MPDLEDMNLVLGNYRRNQLEENSVTTQSETDLVAILPLIERKLDRCCILTVQLKVREL